VRYIGNKTRLLNFIFGVLEERAIIRGRAVDPFTGTASVARALKEHGFHVVAADVMEYGYVFGRAYVAVTGEPDYSGIADDVVRNADESADGPAGDGRGAAGAGSTGPRTADVVAYLNALPRRPGFIHRHFSPAGDVGRRFGRMYFTPANAARIDAIRDTLEDWHDSGRIDEDGFHVLLAALIEAADRVANTTGVYASFVKSWQPNARRRLKLRPPRIVPGNGCRAERADALDLVTDEAPFDLLYLDPPYNTRQYPGYYHVPEIIATGWYDGGVRLRGKTGLMPDDDRRSDWSRRGRCEDAFEELVATARWKHLVMSYNGEGIIPEATIERVLKENGRAATYRRYRRDYKRYRSDADGENRNYTGDRVEEYLYCVSR
jgi:adenine-specific DNA-methyltransferase